MIITLSVALIAAYIIGRLLKVCNYLIALVGVGTGICGGSAIAAIAPIIKAHDDDIAFSMATVFLFNVAAVIIFPVMGHALHLSDTGFGLWAGTAINDTSSVVAAAYSYSKTAGDYATITKLARTTMIIPIALGLAVFMSTRRNSSVSAGSIKKIIPWFILGFVAFACINSTGFLPGATARYCGNIAKFLIVIALTGIGLNANLRNLIKTGARPIMLGLFVWASVAVTSLLIQKICGNF
jgi:uncharacterized integral membrane protein (TIGR00698 family)